MKIKEIEYIISDSDCLHCEIGTTAIMETLKDYPNKQKLTIHNLAQMDHEQFYKLSYKYGFLTCPMIIIDGHLCFHSNPSRSELIETLNKFTKHKCQTTDQEQIQLY